jgi:maltose/moltooligosaccharide transporter
LLNRATGSTLGALSHILSDLHQMPSVMKRLAVAQFFTWIALFIMWIYTTPVVTQYVYGSSDPTSQAFNEGADWVGVLSSIYNGVAAVAAFALPSLAKKIGASKTHMVCLLAGAAGFVGFLFIRNPTLLILPEIGIGIAWASILTMPYVILSATLPQHKLGIYMGIFNFFIVLPQLLIATIMGGIIKSFFPTEPIWTMLVAALVMACAALAMLWVRPAKSPV